MFQECSHVAEGRVDKAMDMLVTADDELMVGRQH